MRTIEVIEAEIDATRQRGRELEAELNAVKLAHFLREAGVPEGAAPIFANQKGDRVMVDAFDGMFPRGKLIKKDGEVSAGTVRVLFSSEYHYVGQAK